MRRLQDGPQLIRRLRIAASVFFVVLTVAFYVLWVRSYRYWDQLHNPVSATRLIVVESAYGHTMLKLATPASGTWVWHLPKKINGSKWDAGFGDWNQVDRNRGVVGFTMYSTPYKRIIRVPTWSLVLLFAILAVTPWDYVPRYSLRTLLIATALVAIVLRLGVWAAG